MVHRNILKHSRHFFPNYTPLIGSHRLSYVEWKSPIRYQLSANEKMIVCVHGLTRNALDFEVFASDILTHPKSDISRVVALDVVGRGYSEWIDPKYYEINTYLSDTFTFFSRIFNSDLYSLDNIDMTFVGTSMGGIHGLTLSSMKDSPIKRLVLNDIPTLIRAEWLQSIHAYISDNPIVSSIDEIESTLRLRYGEASGAVLSKLDWKRMAQNSAIKVESGYQMAYDPKIGDTFETENDVDLRWMYDYNIKIPTLLIRGQRSMLTRREDAELMMRRLNAQMIEVPNVGHTPMLNTVNEIDSILQFINNDGLLVY